MTSMVPPAPATPTVAVSSKPQHIKDLRRTWRKSSQHKVAQVKRFLYSMAGVVSANIFGDLESNRNPLAHFTDVRTSWYYLLPFAYIAWKQVHPEMGASEADSAPGVTIVPNEVTPATTP